MQVQHWGLSLQLLGDTCSQLTLKNYFNFEILLKNSSRGPLNDSRSFYPLHFKVGVVTVIFLIAQSLTFYERRSQSGPAILSIILLKTRKIKNLMNMKNQFIIRPSVYLFIFFYFMDADGNFWKDAATSRHACDSHTLKPSTLILFSSRLTFNRPCFSNFALDKLRINTHVGHFVLAFHSYTNRRNVLQPALQSALGSG